MVTYLQVSDDVAGRVASGDLGAGEGLPSVREAARLYGTTTTTVARAYRCLAGAGVIEVADRRRARVAAGGDQAARRMLAGSPGAPAALRLAGSDDPALDIVLRACGEITTVGARGSFHGLTAMWRGTADAAAIHLRHRSGTHNSPFARTLLRGRRPALIHLWRREQGLLTADGRVTEVAKLPGLRVARRQFGTGTRVLLDRLLGDAGVPRGSVDGPEAASHLEVAMAIASGQADAGLGVRAAAIALDLGFTPVTWEDFDIVLSADALDAAGPLIAALRSPAVRSSVRVLGGYDLLNSGAVRLLG